MWKKYCNKLAEISCETERKEFTIWVVTLCWIMKELFKKIKLQLGCDKTENKTLENEIT